MTFQKLTLLLVAAIFAVALADAAFAGPITIQSFTSDANSGISSSNVYTHAVRFGGNGPSPASYSVNGVAFSPYVSDGMWGPAIGNAPANMSLTANNGTLTGGAGQLEFIGVADNQGSYNILANLAYLYGEGATDTTLVLSNLTPGQQYSARIYYRPWVLNYARAAVVTMSSGAATASLTVNEDGDLVAAAHYLQWDYIAGGSGTLTATFAALADNAPWDFFGITNQVVPEPASLALLGLGAVMVCMRRRR